MAFDNLSEATASYFQEMRSASVKLLEGLQIPPDTKLNYPTLTLTPEDQEFIYVRRDLSPKYKIDWRHIKLVTENTIDLDFDTQSQTWNDKSGNPGGGSNL